ncbi:MAG: sialidase family protein [Ferrovibrio sp.]|uniref:sialidase family protein n=1 Tax=Ferrovibrio sp. TaxID=1917215 RepID=UPI00391BB34F
MSQITGTKIDIAETRDATFNDYAFTDTWPLAANGQRKAVYLKSPGKAGGAIVTAFYTKPAKITVAISQTGGKSWKVKHDIFGSGADPGMTNQLNPALALSSSGRVHLAFRAFGPATAPYGSLWHAHSPDGRAWSAAVQLPPVGSSYHGCPAIAAGPKKTLFIAFDYAGGLYLLRSTDDGETWAPPLPLSQPGGGNTRPSITVDAAGTVYIAFTQAYHLYCAKGEAYGTVWESRKVLGSARLGANYASIALDTADKPVIACYAAADQQGPEPYQGIHVMRQAGLWSETWSEQIIDSTYMPEEEIHTPSLAVSKDGVFQVAYIRSQAVAGLPWPKWPRDIWFRQAQTWNDWAPPQRITQAVDRAKNPQVWPNLYWQSQQPAKDGCLVLWDGKNETTPQGALPWFARSFVSDTFLI